MPRPKIIERRRCLKACDDCKIRKEKCDGLSPCNVCKKRNRETSCTYLTPRTGRGGSISQTAPSQAVMGHSALYNESDLTIESRSNGLGDINAEGETAAPNDADSPASAPVPKLSRLMRDEKGGLTYIGDSASISFLQTIRRLVSASIGACGFTTDELRHLLIEATPNNNYEGFENAELTLGTCEIIELAKQFFLATSGALHLFESSSIIERISLWMEDRSRADWPDSPIFHLLLAIGAQARACGPEDERLSHLYFEFGHRQAQNHLLDDLSILTVQAFLLVTWYLIVACRRNRATVALGIAVQAAFALGIHRTEANVLCGQSESISRERAWKTLRVCDLFLSASMGRPSITSNIDRNIPSALDTSQNGNWNTDFDDRMSSAMVRICYIFERILSEVYPKRAVSLELAASISKQHREWTVALPEMLKIDGLSQTEQHSAADLTPFLGSTIVVQAYFYSIILLTRPFLTFHVHCHIKSKKEWRDDNAQSQDVTTYSDACVDSAIKGIEMAHDVLQYDGMPNRLPLVINSVFISALSLGLAYFGDYDSSGWRLDNGLTQAIAVLRHYGSYNPQSARYQQIVELLWSAASEYKINREEGKSLSRSQLVRTVFGNASAQVVGQRPAAAHPKPMLNSDGDSSVPANGVIEGVGQDLMDEIDLPVINNFEMLLRSSMITTSGGLTPINQDGGHYSQNASPDGGLNTFFNGVSPFTSPNFSFGDDIPLFAVMNEFHAQ